jgi:hypothetical protein
LQSARIFLFNYRETHMSNDRSCNAAHRVRVRKLALPTAMLLFALLATGGAGAQSFSDTLQTAATSRGAGDAPLSHLQVSVPTAVTSISVLNDIESAQNQKFLIYNNTTATSLFVSGPQAFAANGAGVFSWKQSAAFAAVTLQPGNDYLVGAISDTAGNWAYNTGGSFTQGSITSLQTNGNVANFTTPATNCCAGGRIPLQLNASSAAQPSVPVPTLGPPALLWTVLAVALFGLAGLGRRSQTRL